LSDGNTDGEQATSLDVLSALDMMPILAMRMTC